jgi:hypothetical protein
MRLWFHRLLELYLYCEKVGPQAFLTLQCLTSDTHASRACYHRPPMSVLVRCFLASVFCPNCLRCSAYALFLLPRDATLVI